MASLAPIHVRHGHADARQRSRVFKSTLSTRPTRGPKSGRRRHTRRHTGPDATRRAGAASEIGRQTSMTRRAHAAYGVTPAMTRASHAGQHAPSTTFGVTRTVG